MGAATAAFMQGSEGWTIACPAAAESGLSARPETGGAGRPSLRYDPAMQPQETATTSDPTPVQEPALAEFDVWRWHVEGQFPKDRPPEQGYVHIGMYVAWLIGGGFIDPDWVARAGVGRAVAAVAERRDSPCALRDMTDGRLAGEMLTP
jgi:hypothetical protein